MKLFNNKVLNFSERASDYFGTSKYYDIFFLKSAEKPLVMAASLGTYFQTSFRFLKEFHLLSTFPDLSSPLYYASLNPGKEANLVLMPNSVTVPAASLALVSNPILGGLLFDEDYFLFSNRANALYRTDFGVFEYMLLFSCKKSFNESEEVQKVLQSQPSWHAIQQTQLLDESLAGSSKKNRTNFLKELFMDLEDEINEEIEKRIKRRLHGRTEIPVENYCFRRFEGVNPLTSYLSNTYFLREDV